MHRQANDLVSHLSGDWKILWSCAWQAPIGTECANQRIEIATAKNALLFHLEIEFIAGYSVLLGINKDREITIVVTYTRHIVKETNTRNIP